MEKELPWKKDFYGNVLDASGNQILLTGFALNSGRFSEDAKDNSDYIFNAVNSHDKLVKALEAMVAEFCKSIPDHCNPDMFDEYNHAIEALAAAKGE